MRPPFRTSSAVGQSLISLHHFKRVDLFRPRSPKKNRGSRTRHGGLVVGRVFRLYFRLVFAAPLFEARLAVGPTLAWEVKLHDVGIVPPLLPQPKQRNRSL